MKDKYYEKHRTDNDQPMILHTDLLKRNGFLRIDSLELIAPSFRAHWHENIELLYVTEGECDVSSNAVRVHACPGDLAIVNSNMVHKVEATTEYVKYYCLIVDTTFCKNLGIDIEHIFFERLVEKNSETSRLYNDVVRCARGDGEYKHLELKLKLFALAIHLVKEHTDGDFSARQYSNPKV